MTQIALPSRTGAEAARLGVSPELPCRIGEWELVALAAEGSLARVYRARAATTPVDRPAAYAVKMLRERWRDDPRAIRLLQREAVAGRSVAHRHLVSILAARISRPPRFVVMPWLEGATLRALLTAGRHVDLPEVLWIARQVAEALAALHTAGWMHGDVKPGNIFVSPQRHVTLLDLGFARRADEAGSAADRCVLGTYHYLAPEMIVSAVRADIRSDVYSHGVVLHELLSGRLPFDGEDLAELVSQHRQAAPPDLQRLAPRLPIEVVGLVREMLAKEPLRRPQTPCELIDRLAELEIATFAQRAVA